MGQCLDKRPNTDNEKLLLLGGLDGNAKHSVVKYVEDTWQKSADSLESIDHSAVALNNTHVFVVDGYRDDCIYGHIQVYDINNDLWSIIENILKTPRMGATATIIHNKLYLFGGCSGRDYLSSSEVFDISGASCVTCDNHGIPELQVARCAHASVTINNTVYFIGGYNNQYLSSCESINVATGEASKLPSLQQARESLSAVLFEDNIIAIGGFSGASYLDSVESFSFLTNQWTMMASMTIGRQGHCAVVYKHQIFVIGGGDDSANTIEVYDADTKQWKVHSNLTTPRFGASVVKL